MAAAYNIGFASPSTSGSSVVIPAVPGMAIKVLSMVVMSSAAQTISFLSNTTAISAAMPVAANGGFVLPASSGNPGGLNSGPLHFIRGCRPMWGKR